MKKTKKAGQILICGTQYSVTKVPDLIDDSVGKVNGRIRMNPAEIELSSDLCDARMSEVLLHEIVHGIDNHLEIGLKEDDVQRLANGLHQLGFGEVLLERIYG